MTKYYNGLNFLKPIDDLYLSVDSMKSILMECTGNEVAVVGMDFYEKVGESYVKQKDNSKFDYVTKNTTCISWKDYVLRCNNLAYKVLSNSDSETFCTYISLKTN